MSTIQQTAEAFVSHSKAICHNAYTDGYSYYLHGNCIAQHDSASRVIFNWCGYFTPTTANHLNNIARVLGSPTRFSYAQARDGKAPSVGYFE